MSEERRRVALVTGASAGIGEAFAGHLASRGFDLVITARRLEMLRSVAERLQEEHGINCRVIPADLTEPEAPRRILYELARDEVDVDVLVNNAGYGLEVPLDEIEWPQARGFMEVMAVSWLHFIRLFAPPMIERGWGRIANIASLAAFAPESEGSLYSGVKAQMLVTSRGLRRRFLDTGVHCTAICPGFTHSEFHAQMGMPEVSNSTPSWLWQSADAVVTEGWKACERNRAVVVTGTTNKIIRGLLGAIPTPLVERLTPKSVENIRTRRAKTTT